MNVSTSGFHNVQSIRVTPVTALADGVGNRFRTQTLVLLMADGSHHAMSIFLSEDGSGLPATAEEWPLQDAPQVALQHEGQLNSSEEGM